jgi:hypothetical protein
MSCKTGFFCAGSSSFLLRKAVNLYVKTSLTDVTKLQKVLGSSPNVSATPKKQTEGASAGVEFCDGHPSFHLFLWPA